MIQIGGVYTTFCQEEGILLQEHREKDARCIAILFKSIGVRGRFDSPEKQFVHPTPLPQSWDTFAGGGGGADGEGSSYCVLFA